MMKSLIFFLILISIQQTHAQVACVDLFNHTRPSEDQINAAIYELAHLLKDKHSKDPATRLFAKKESEKKLSELMLIMDRSEIKVRLLAYINANPATQKDTTHVELRQAGEKIVEELARREEAIQNFLRENNFENVYTKNSFDETTLMLASAKRQKEMVKILLEYEIDVNHRSMTGQTALGWAKRNNADAELIKLLEDAGATE